MASSWRRSDSSRRAAARVMRLALGDFRGELRVQAVDLGLAVASGERAAAQGSRRSPRRSAARRAGAAAMSAIRLMPPPRAGAAGRNGSVTRKWPPRPPATTCDAAAMRLGEFARDGEAEAGALGAAEGAGAAAKERLEYRLALLQRHARAGVERCRSSPRRRPVRARTRISPPAGVNLIALPSRLSITERSFAASAQTVIGARRRVHTRCPLACAASWCERTDWRSSPSSATGAELQARTAACSARW